MLQVQCAATVGRRPTVAGFHSFLSRNLLKAMCISQEPCVFYQTKFYLILKFRAINNNQLLIINLAAVHNRTEF